MDLDIYSFEECQKLKIVYQIMNPEGVVVCEGDDNTTVEFWEEQKKDERSYSVSGSLEFGELCFV